ncbi:phosphatidylinositol transfer protein [Necator americanus]|uniref:Phosphatidylinositol transfer protein n=1 Tax=Necator americanus TaxID=51031 RepID=W2SNE1_NECAM|nr:phosphatidylinositol transfer protein [Necator americanus]ETN71053.1 phosphatidylinositol transfer protein [Necator americanus]
MVLDSIDSQHKKEFRIPLPLEVEEFRRGQLYSVAEASKNETGGGEGAEFVKQYDFFDDPSILPGKTLSGTYTYKIYRLKSKAPWVLQKIFPSEAFEIHEESWNAYPYCKTLLTVNLLCVVYNFLARFAYVTSRPLQNPGYMGSNFSLIIESIHLPDYGCSDNPLNAPEKREIIYLDICDDIILGKCQYNPDTDPKLFISERTGRGRLKPDWMYSTTPVRCYKQIICIHEKRLKTEISENCSFMTIMCCYKLVTVHFKWTGLSGFVEKTIQKQYSKIFTRFHRDAFCWIDYWIDLNEDELREFEEKIAVQLLKQLAEPEKRGATLDDRPIID